MIKYRFIVSYDGTDFCGWQFQPQQPTIVGTMQQSFKSLFNKEIKIIGASRTDAGVHAIGQVATFCTDITIDADRLIKAFNNALPSSIVINELQQVDECFHPIYNVAEKEYWYHFFLERPTPFVKNYGWFVHYPVDLGLLEQALQLFVGTYDFRSFCTGTDMGENTVRTVHSITLSKEQFGAWRITVKGPGFMRHMIRRMVGAAIQVAADRYTIAEVQSILEKKDPKHTLLNAPAYGLCLYKINYKN